MAPELNRYLGHCRAMMNAHAMFGDIAGASIWADRAIDMYLNNKGGIITV